MAMSPLRTRVLVVGAGVVGATLALELAHHKIPCMVVERAVRGLRTPTLEVLGSRSMELLRRLGLADRIRQREVDPSRPCRVEWTEDLDHPPVYLTRRPPNRRHAFTADGRTTLEPYAQVSATALATELRDAMRRDRLIDLREGWTFTGLRVDGDGAVGSVLAGHSGHRHAVTATYVVGCDGARSTVRSCLDITLDRLGPSQRYCSVHFRSHDPRLRPRSHAQRTLVIGDMVLLSPTGDGTWIGHLPVAGSGPATDPVDTLRRRLGIQLDRPEVLGVTEWDAALSVATRYGRGPVYLAGEAAHPFHPVTDRVDTSIGDAVNLGWKLAAMINGWGGPALLASYEMERRSGALIDREILARAQETLRRYRRLHAAGATSEFLVRLMRQELPQIGDLDLHSGHQYGHSAVIWPEPEPLDGVRGSRSATWPGSRAPTVRLLDGSAMFDRFGPEFTLVDLTPDAAGGRLVDAARSQGVPMAHLSTEDVAVRSCWDRPLVLVRPDQHIAWRSATVPDNWPAVLDRVTGHQTT
ncbi:FAD-dependent monooxygenase [Solwaraspora sp. WMMB335]|uniref:FAD-dependent monooxygenase n=1 Tax=Solwaraspora sp. WMMB335 TaxID=3404118 RepID=UPI003B95847D